DVTSSNKLFFEKKPLRNLGIILTDIKKTPSRGISNLIQDIKTSSILIERDISIFDTQFLHNASLMNEIGYFIDDSNANAISIPNLKELVDEFIKRIDNSPMKGSE
ncbi:ParA family protein, partial [Latilactobacillus curvatus]|nr:ParA family protein [Latilactobacillus curvatus]